MIIKKNVSYKDRSFIALTDDTRVIESLLKGEGDKFGLQKDADTDKVLFVKNKQNKNFITPQIAQSCSMVESYELNDILMANFSHNSPTYGSPFKMMQEAGITYKTAGENIAGNQSAQKAVESWLESETHKQNILSNAYNYIGIGLEPSDTYGYVIVVMFIGK